MTWRYADGRWPNTGAIGYAVLGWLGGIALLLAAPGPWGLALVAGTLLTAHALIVSAYLLHEFAHLSIFKDAKTNARFGTLMTWITGSCYARYDDLRRKHMRHHVDRADVLTFDTKVWLQQGPAWRRRLVLALEWAYVPAVEFVMHGYVMVQPFLRAERQAEQRRVIVVTLVRAAAFTALGIVSPWGLAGYAVAYMIMLTVLRFTDAYQHTYDAYAVLEDGAPIPADKVRDRTYEQTNTYSNLVSAGWPGLNLLLLNFPYHNAHHERPIEPWYRLPALHRQLFPGEHAQTLPMVLCLRSFHRHRVRRVLSDDYGVYGSGERRADGFYGAVGVSFLTAV